MTMSTVSQLSQNGFVSLQNGRFQLAHRFFNECMILLEQQTESESFEPSSIASANKKDGFAQPDLKVHACSLELDLNSENITSHNLFCLFDRVFLPLSRRDGAVEATVMGIYNMAITHHVHAATRSDGSAHHFRRALHFYRLALEAAETCSVTTYLEDPCYLIKLAIHNNLCHILCHFQETLALTETAKALILLMPELCLHPGISERDTSFFCSSAFTTPWILAGAAAAA